MIHQQEHKNHNSCPNKHYICKKVIGYILKDHDIKDLLSNNKFLTKVCNECEDKSINETIPFNILDLPIEIEDCDFNFTAEELENSGVDILSDKLINEVEKRCFFLSVPLLVYPELYGLRFHILLLIK